MLITQLAYGESMLYSARTAGSRGGALAMKNGSELPESIEYRGKKILTTFEGDNISITERAVRPLPVERNLWFETVWKEYLKKRSQL